MADKFAGQGAMRKSSRGKDGNPSTSRPPTSLPITPPAPIGPPLPQQYNPQTYEQQLAGQLSPGFQIPTPIQGQFPMQGVGPMGQQPGFGQGGFNPMQGLFGAYAPQGGMFSGLFGGQ